MTTSMSGTTIPDSPIVTALYLIGAVILIILLFKSGPPEDGDNA